jgi:hypothetical protein
MAPPPPPAIGLPGRKIPTAQDQPTIVAPEPRRLSPKKDARQAGYQEELGAALNKPLKHSRPSTPASKTAEIEAEIELLHQELTDPKTNKFRMSVLRNTDIPKAEARLEEAKKAN